MKRILLLGGIGEALWLARRLASRYTLTYSLAGRARIAELSCALRTGGFGGAAGLQAYLEAGGFDLLIDATHPYAAQISDHAAQAARQSDLALWVYRRPPWRPAAGDNWCTVADWNALTAALAGFRRPFFTIGTEVLAYAGAVPIGQYWLVRTLGAEGEGARVDNKSVTLLGGRGPFALADELALLRNHRSDVLISKNSGGPAVAAKLEAARQLRLPVLMLERPRLPTAGCLFTDIAALASQLGC